VILDAYSRRVIGWALSRTLEDTLTLRALRMALEQRRPAPGLVHHSDRGVQYASGDYTDLLRAHGIVISMSRKANPYDNAKAESFMKTLKYEEVFREDYRDLAEAHTGIGRFLEQVYNQKRLHSALGIVRPPNSSSRCGPTRGSGEAHRNRFGNSGVCMSFFRHEEIYRPMDSKNVPGRSWHDRPRPHRYDEFPAGYSSAGCAPAEPVSASQPRRILQESAQAVQLNCSER